MLPSVVLAALLSASCAVPGSAAMTDLQAGMSREQVGATMRSHGLKPDDSRGRPSGGWTTYGQDPFAAGIMAGEFERETGQRVEWAEVYHIAGPDGSSVIHLYYDGAGRLLQ